MESSPSIWRYIVNVKSTVRISSIFVAFLENTNFMTTNLSQVKIPQLQFKYTEIFDCLEIP